MTESSQAVKLHHRWALGEELTPAEQQILDTWYAEQDAKEAAMLKLEVNSDELTQALKKQISEMLRQIAASVKQIQALTAENEELKRENDKLKHLLTQRLRQQRA